MPLKQQRRRMVNMNDNHHRLDVSKYQCICRGIVLLSCLYCLSGSEWMLTNASYGKYKPCSSYLILYYYFSFFFREMGLPRCKIDSLISVLLFRFDVCLGLLVNWIQLSKISYKRKEVYGEMRQIYMAQCADTQTAGWFCVLHWLLINFRYLECIFGGHIGCFPSVEYQIMGPIWMWNAIRRTHRHLIFEVWICVGRQSEVDVRVSDRKMSMFMAVEKVNNDWILTCIECCSIHTRRRNGDVRCSRASNSETEQRFDAKVSIAWRCTGP